VFIACLPVGRVLDDATPSCGSSRYRSYCDLIEGLRSYYDYHESMEVEVIGANILQQSLFVQSHKSNRTYMSAISILL
jgi:hypothetical protein